MESLINRVVRPLLVLAVATLTVGACGTTQETASLEDLADPAQTRSALVADTGASGSGGGGSTAADSAGGSDVLADPAVDLTDMTDGARDFRYANTSFATTVYVEDLAKPGAFAMTFVDVTDDQQPAADLVARYITAYEGSATWGKPSGAADLLGAMTATSRGQSDGEEIDSWARLGFSLYGGARHELSVTEFGTSTAVVRDCVQASNLWLITDEGTVSNYPSDDAYIDVAGAEPPEVATYRLTKIEGEWKIHHIARPARTVTGEIPENCTQEG